MVNHALLPTPASMASASWAAVLPAASTALAACDLALGVTDGVSGGASVLVGGGGASPPEAETARCEWSATKPSSRITSVSAVTSCRSVTRVSSRPGSRRARVARICSRNELSSSMARSMSATSARPGVALPAAPARCRQRLFSSILKKLMLSTGS